MGILGLEVPYKNDQMEGVAKEYDENGSLWKETSYKNGELDGVAKEYYPNGNLNAETHFKNGELEGISNIIVMMEAYGYKSLLAIIKPYLANVVMVEI